MAGPRQAFGFAGRGSGAGSATTAQRRALTPARVLRALVPQEEGGRGPDLSLATLPRQKKVTLLQARRGRISPVFHPAFFAAVWMGCLGTRPRR